MTTKAFPSSQTRHPRAIDAPHTESSSLSVSVALLAAILTAGPLLAQPKAPPGATRPAPATSRPTFQPTSRAASARFATVPKALVDRWLDLKQMREAAVAFARSVDEAGIEQARRTYNELRTATQSFNEAIAPYANASPMRYPSPVPKPGAGEAIWFYKACRAIETYNTAHKDEEDDMSYAVLKFTNEYRESLGLVPLEVDDRLVDAAHGHSSWMSQTGTVEHESDLPGKKTPDQRIRSAGYVWRGCAENIASGQPTPDIVFRDWFNSYHHHRNFVGNYTHLGIANIQNYWTQDFGIGEPLKAGRER